MSKRKPYSQPLKPFWWLSNKFYVSYILRSSTSIFIALYSLILLSGLYRLNQGAPAFEQWLECMRSPFMMILSLLTLVAVMFHTTTWFSLAPKTMYLQLGGKKVDDHQVTLAYWAAFGVAALTMLILFLIL